MNLVPYDEIFIDLHFIFMILHNYNFPISFAVASYDITTVGAFSAYSQKYKPGGLNRMLAIQRQNYSPESTLGKKVKMDTVCDIRNDLMTLKQAINSDCDRLCHAALQASSTELRKRMDIVVKKVMILHI